MQQKPKKPCPDYEAVMDRYQAFFGRGWKQLYASAIGVRTPTISERGGTMTKYAEIILELLTELPPHRWPERFAALAELRKAKIKADRAEAQKTETETTPQEIDT